MSRLVGLSASNFFLAKFRFSKCRVLGPPHLVGSGLESVVLSGCGVHAISCMHIEMVCCRCTFLPLLSESRSTNRCPDDIELLW